ncbi:MAG: toll/interleukin-1 receptor domain-containing protein [Myxococcota bacterium]
MIRVFVSYSHRDEPMREELEVHLAALKRQGVIEVWHDRCIDAGNDIDREISAELERAELVLLLVSPYFLASDYCYDIEMTRALRRHEAGEARVIPVILHPCDWHGAPFGKLRATPTDGKPISKFANSHDAYLEVVSDIRAAVGPKPGAATASLGFDNVPRTATQPQPPRSSNLRVKTPFSDRDRDDFRDQSFEYIANYFENSLEELSRRHPELDTRFRRNAANEFTAAVYLAGQKRTSCTVRLGADLAGDITYAHGDAIGGGFNEALGVEHDGYAPSLRALGLGSFSDRAERSLSQEGAGEHLWEMFIRPMQL